MNYGITNPTLPPRLAGLVEIPYHIVIQHYCVAVIRKKKTFLKFKLSGELSLRFIGASFLSNKFGISYHFVLKKVSLIIDYITESVFFST